MLDWLITDQNAQCADSSRILEAPETPAPVFAYRALKSVLFGSYDGYESDEGDKENIRLEDLSPRVLTRSQKTPRKSTSSAVTPQRPTPRRVLSPAKSILRTPGVPTPRRQNVSVKFKDTKSTPVNLGAISEGNVEKENESPGPAQRKQSPIGKLESQTSKTAATELVMEERLYHPAPPAETYYNVEEMDAYVAATEREMKKLVRYGQRMREYTRLIQKENAFLKAELGDAGKEINALRTKEHQKSHKGQSGEEGKDVGLFDLALPSTSPSKVAAQNCSAAKRGVPGSSLNGHSQTQPRAPTPEAIAKNPRSPRCEKGEDEGAGSMLKARLRPNMRQEPSPRPSAVLGVTMAARTQLAPDRLAAAKARLRVKSEERKRILSAGDNSNKEDQGLSVIDWQDL